VTGVVVLAAMVEELGRLRTRAAACDLASSDLAPSCRDLLPFLAPPSTQEDVLSNVFQRQGGGGVRSAGSSAAALQRCHRYCQQSQQFDISASKQEPPARDAPLLRQ
jgi:hypothetical protein